MTLTKRSWIVWLVPFLVSGGMAIGALIGLASVSDAMAQEGPAGDMAGAAGALMMVICLVVGFVVATLTLVTAKLLRRGRLDRIALRVGLSIVGGGVIGALGANPGDVTTGAAWLLLVGVPIALTWPPHTGGESSAQGESAERDAAERYAAEGEGQS